MIEGNMAYIHISYIANNAVNTTQYRIQNRNHSENLLKRTCLQNIPKINFDPIKIFINYIMLAIRKTSPRDMNLTNSLKCKNAGFYCSVVLVDHVAEFIQFLGFSSKKMLRNRDI